MPQTVLVTGVARPLGTTLVHRLITQRRCRVVGIDTVEPTHAPKNDRFEFIRADIRGQRLTALLRKIAPTTIVHLDVTGVAPVTGRRADTKEVTVIGTMRLLAASQRLESLRALIVRSATAVYGCSPQDPAVFTEATGAKTTLRGYGKDISDVESYLRAFGRGRSDVTTTVLRFANVLSRDIPTPLAEYFTAAAPPTVFGHDARLQFVHIDDVTGVIDHVLAQPTAGVFNVAGDGVLMLSQALRRSGRIGVPMPKTLVGPYARAMGLTLQRDQLDLLSYGRCVDTTRLRQVVGYQPKYTTAAAFGDFAAANPGPLAALRGDETTRELRGVAS